MNESCPPCKMSQEDYCNWHWVPLVASEAESVGIWIPEMHNGNEESWMAEQSLKMGGKRSMEELVWKWVLGVKTYFCTIWLHTSPTNLLLQVENQVCFLRIAGTSGSLPWKGRTIPSSLETWGTWWLWMRTWLSMPSFGRTLAQMLSSGKLFSCRWWNCRAACTPT